jgi:hypothetical protein
LNREHNYPYTKLQLEHVTTDHKSGHLILKDNMRTRWLRPSSAAFAEGAVTLADWEDIIKKRLQRPKKGLVESM